MSPSRTRKPVARARPRSEVITAVAAAVGIAAATTLLVWLMRPGQPGEPGGGGLLSRQSRATLLVVLTAGAMAAAIWWVLRGRRRPRRLSPRVAVSATAFVVLGGAVTAAILWPGGLVRHWPRQVKQVETPQSTPVATAPPITSKQKTPGTTAKTSPTSKPGQTTASTKGK
jgi:hypothetical protein